MLARQAHRYLAPVEYDIVGGNTRDMVKHDGRMYKGPEWFTDGANDAIYCGINK